MEKIDNTINAIEDLDSQAMIAAKERQDQLTKPQGSLGVLEEISIRLAGITGNPRPHIDKKVVIVMAGDHGVVAEGVSAFPSEVTPQMVANFAAGGAGINVISRHVGATVKVVDIGVAADIREPLVLQEKIRRGTNNMAQGPAMTRVEALESILTGVKVAEAEIEAGADILAMGDMGIGNTTASTAILAALSELNLEEITGRGTGVDDNTLQIKMNAIRRALKINQPEKNDPIDVLAKVGGLEIGGLAGVALGAAKNRIPVVVDGFISGAGALIATKLAPKSVNYMFASHVSVEPGHQLILREIGLTPMLHMNMRLGEGTGAALAISLIDVACKIINEMATFLEAGVAEKEEKELTND